LNVRDRVVLLPIMARETYLRVNAACDVMLDSLHWSGGNTSLDAFAAGLPVVTLPGEFMRGRQTLGMLRTLGLDELIARDPDDYVRLAVDVATDESWQAALRERIRAAHGNLFHDREAIAAMQRFYLSLWA